MKINRIVVFVLLTRIIPRIDNGIGHNFRVLRVLAFQRDIFVLNNNILVIYPPRRLQNISLIRVVKRGLYRKMKRFLRNVIDNRYSMGGIAVYGLIAQSEPTGAALAPCPYNAVRIDSKAVPVSCRNRDNPRKRQVRVLWIDDSYRRCARVIEAIA